MTTSLTITVDQADESFQTGISMDESETVDEIVFLCQVLAYAQLCTKYNCTKEGLFASPLKPELQEEFDLSVQKFVESYAGLRTQYNETLKTDVAVEEAKVVANA